MKKFVLILFTIFIYNSVTAQAKEIFSPEYKFGTVFLFGGSTLNGFILIKENSDIKFKQTLDSNEKIIYYKTSIESIVFEDATFLYKTVINKSSEERKALQVEIDGDVVLFNDSFMRTMVGHPYGSVGYLAGAYKPEVHYYLGKKGQTEVIHIGFPNSFSKNFKKITEDYFGSCPILFAKIDNREFERSDIQGIVNFYNNECNKIDIND